jgi:chromosome segregation ATPase
MHNPDNPPSNPELLQLLADQIAAMKFDMRAFLRELALANAYQRSFDPPTDVAAVQDAVTKEIARVEGERGALALTSKESSDSYSKAAEAWEQVESTTIPVATELDKLKTQIGDAKKKVDETAKAAAEAKSQLDAKKAVTTPVEQAASAIQAAVKLLPADKELADAAQKIVTRAQQLSAEMATLGKAAEEKSAALAPVTDAWNKTKPSVEVTLQKVNPLNAKLKEAETAMLAAREKAEREKERLAALERRLATVQKTAQVADLTRAAVTASQAVAAQQTSVAAAQKLLEEYAPIASAQETAAKVHADTAAAVAKALEAAQAEHFKKAEITDAIATAYKTLKAACEKSPNDGALADAANKLAASADAAQAAANDAQKKVDAANAARQTADQAVVAAQEALAGVVAERARREKSAAAAIDALTSAKADLATKQSALSTAQSELTERWSNDFTVAALKPLMPEQLCWSVFRVTGVYDRYWQTEVAEFDKSKPLSDEQKKDAAQINARNAELEQRTYDKLKGNIGTFVTYYGAAAGQPQGDFFATADQALFAANAGPINSWVAPAGGNVTERVIKQADPNAAADELYLAVLSRRPTDTERAEVAKYLNDRGKDKAIAAQELVWALLTSAEFRFNH